MAFSFVKAVGSGMVGALTLTLLHESARQVLPDAPRVDLLGMQAVAKSLRKVGKKRPAKDQLHRLSLAGDLVSNSLYYSLVGLGGPGGAVARGLGLGVAAGVGAVALPEPLGLDKKHIARTTETQAMTIGWYLVGGLAAAITYMILSRQPGA